MSTSLRGLISEGYTDMLETASTIVGMAQSSESLCSHLSSVQKTIQEASNSISNPRNSLLSPISNNKSSSHSIPHPHPRRRSSTRISSGLSIPTEIDGEEEEHLKREKEQNAIYSIALELRLILDSPELIWRCVERGNTLRAAWIWLVARSVWWDIQAMDGSIDGKGDSVDDHRKMDVLVSRKMQTLASLKRETSILFPI